VNAPDPDALTGLVRAVYLAMTARPRRAVPDAATLALLDRPLPADLHALLHAWTFHAAPVGSTRRWDVFAAWDFGFSIAPSAEREVDRVCRALAASSARAPVGPGFYVELGADGGGVQVFATVRDGRTAVFGPEHGEDHGDLDDFFFKLQERHDGELDPALAEDPPDE
jgi:hypothetical protein